MSHSDFNIKQGDNRPDLIVVLQDENGPINLDGVDEVRFHMSDRDSKDIFIDAEATALQSGSEPNFVDKGKVMYRFSTDDTASYGEFYGEFQVSFVSGEVLSFPNDETEPLLITISREIA